MLSYVIHSCVQPADSLFSQWKLHKMQLPICRMRCFVCLYKSVLNIFGIGTAKRKERKTIEISFSQQILKCFIQYSSKYL